MMTVHRFEEGTCAFCSKDREGFSVTMDGSELFLCKPDFIRTVKMRSAVQPKAPHLHGLTAPAERNDVI